VLTAAVLFFGALLAHGADGGIDLADAPLFTKINPPPTNLMMLLDDSGSMTFEILVKGLYDGLPYMLIPIAVRLEDSAMFSMTYTRMTMSGDI
jgi:hypothetical protein